MKRDIDWLELPGNILLALVLAFGLVVMAVGALRMRRPIQRSDGTGSGFNGKMFLLAIVAYAGLPLAIAWLTAEHPEVVGMLLYLMCILYAIEKLPE